MDENLLSQAQSIWGMLDEMALNNPSSYRTFIDKQLKEGKEFMKPPDAHMCVRTSIYSTTKTPEPLHINVFSWQKVPEPKDTEAPVPVMGSPLQYVTENGVSSQVVNVAFHPNICQEYGKDCKVKEHQEALINLAMDYIQDQNKDKSITISRQYTILDNIKHKGELKSLLESFKLQTSKDSNNENQFSPDLDFEDGRDSIMNKFANLTGDNANVSNRSNEPQIELFKTNSGTQSKTSLIQELNNKGEVKLPEPEYSVDVKEASGSKPRRTVVKIKLPMINSIKECELDISEEELSLCVPQQIELKLKFPDSVCDESASAKYSVKSQCLTVTVPNT